MTDQSATPLLTALAIAAAREHTAFYAPGHKQGQGVSAAWRDLVGRSALQADLPELPELDNLFAPAGPIDEAQRLAAQTFGAEATFFLANGSTCGIEAAILAVSGPGVPILIPRNAHRSVLSGLVLSGATPIYLAPMQTPQWDLALGVTVPQIELALQAHPEIRAVVVVSPNYHGVCADVAAIARCVHRHGAVLIVDAAHGAHLGWHPELPQSAIAAGADIAIQSTHKTLAALTQAAMLHVQGERVNRDRLRQALQLTQSTSPNYLLLASLDAARHQIAMAGITLMGDTLAIAHRVRQRLQSLAPLTVLTPAHLAMTEFQLDPTRLVVDVSALGLTGFAADEWLHEQPRVTAELPTLRQLAFIFSLGNRPVDGDRLIVALQALVDMSDQIAADRPPACADPPTPATAYSQPLMTPREAFFATAQALPMQQTVGHIAADALCPYPPGIPVLLPGEIVTAEAIAQLAQIHQAGGVITGNPDTTWETLRVILSSD